MSEPTGISCPRLGFSGQRLLHRHCHRRGSLARGPAEKCLLESRVSGGPGFDDGSGAAFPRRGTTHVLRGSLADFRVHYGLLQSAFLDSDAESAPQLLAGAHAGQRVVQGPRLLRL